MSDADPWDDWPGDNPFGADDNPIRQNDNPLRRVGPFPWRDGWVECANDNPEASDRYDWPSSTPPVPFVTQAERYRLAERFRVTIPLKKYLVVVYYNVHGTAVLTAYGQPFLVRGDIIYLQLNPTRRLGIPIASLISIKAFTSLEQTMQKQPLADSELRNRLAAFPKYIGTEGFVAVQWWKKIEDPALESLGGGIRTLTIGKAAALDDETLQLSMAVTSKELGQHVASIPRDRLLNIEFLGETSLNDDQIRKLVDGGPVA